MHRGLATTTRRGMMFAAAALLIVPTAHAQTTFTFGGSVKLDALYSKYRDGQVGSGSPLRDIHFPAAIPVGGDNDVLAELDVHAKESRFNLSTVTTLPGGEVIRAFLEMDFLLAGQGDERASNSYNPRLRHFYFTYSDFLFGQTWSTFMILEPVVEDLDFAGTAEGMIFVRQPQVRYSKGPIQLAIESPEVTLDDGAAGRLTTESATLPDIVVRYNLMGDWGSLSVAGLARQIKHEFDNGGTTEANNAVGVAASAGGRINVGARDDLRFEGTAGRGVGRYAAFNFANAGAIDAQHNVESTPSYLGFVGYRHVWTDKLRTNVNISGFYANNDAPLSGGGVNKSAYSLSANLLWSPQPPLTFGVELMRAYRELESNVSGKFDRLQFSGMYRFSFSNRS